MKLRKSYSVVNKVETLLIMTNTQTRCMYVHKRIYSSSDLDVYIAVQG